MHFTWKCEYNDFAIVVDDPEIVTQGVYYLADNYAIESGCWFWSEYKGIGKKIDNGEVDSVIAVTKLVNGGINSLKDRTDYYEKIIDLFQ